ncbi:MAG: hypothetical protein L0H83_14280 [Salinisphaera sp.]|nr:hypothetical protein [Salinisphaera sp.]
MAVRQASSETEVVAYLAALDTDAVPHTGRTLLAHLRGTAVLVADWGLPRSVVLAALCHSLYGTERFAHVSLNPGDRTGLQQLIGRQAEHLVFLFHCLRRASLFSGHGAAGLRWINGGDLHATSREFAYLACIGIANFIETLQNKGFHARCRLMGTRHHWANVEPYLPTQTNARIATIYASNHVPGPVVAGAAFVRRCKRRVRHPMATRTCLNPEIL